MKCECGRDMTLIYGNFSFTRRSIEIQLVAGQAWVCDCGRRVFPDEIEDRVNGLLDEKVTNFPDSPPYIFINFLAIKR